MSVKLQHCVRVEPRVDEPPLLVQRSQLVGTVVFKKTQDINVHWHFSRRLNLSLSEEHGLQISFVAPGAHGRPQIGTLGAGGGVAGEPAGMRSVGVGGGAGVASGQHETETLLWKLHGCSLAFGFEAAGRGASGGALAAVHHRAGGAAGSLALTHS